MRRNTFPRRRLLQGIPLVLIGGKTQGKASEGSDRERLEKVVARHGSEIGDIRKVGR